MKYISLQSRRIITKILQHDIGNGYVKNVFAKSMTGRYFSSEATIVHQKVLLDPDLGHDSDTVKVLQTVKMPCPGNSRMMRVSIIGVPNAGKSTIINALTNYDVCPVSRRPHTTRKNQKAIYLDENTQLVFVDTPGLVNGKEIKKFSFKDEFVFGPEKSIGHSHVIAVIHDVSASHARDKLDFRIKGILEKFPDKKSILILNKIDQVPAKSALLETVKYLTCGIVGGNPLPVRTFEEKKASQKRLDTEALLSKAKERYEDKQSLASSTEEDLATHIASKLFSKGEIKRGIHQIGWPKFDDVFMVSTLQGDGVDLLRRYMVVNAVPHQWLFDSETLTDVPPKTLVLDILRAKLLDYLPQEIPFSVKPVLEFWEENDIGVLSISIILKCPKERYQCCILGTGGSLIKRIIDDTEIAVSRLLNCLIKLTLNPVFDKSMTKLKGRLKILTLGCGGTNVVS